jgi:hypothetical protein
MQRPIVWRFCQLAIPGGAAMALEVAAFVATTAMAGHLGSIQVAAHASAFSLTGVTLGQLCVSLSCKHGSNVTHNSRTPLCAALAFMCIPGAMSISVSIRRVAQHCMHGPA